MKGISFEVRKGKVFGLLGHNGAGKSTTINLLLGLKEPDEGLAEILGKKVSKNSPVVIWDEVTAALDPIAEYETHASLVNCANSSRELKNSKEKVRQLKSKL